MPPCVPFSLIVKVSAFSSSRKKRTTSSTLTGPNSSETGLRTSVA
jgi:hypothetical protein